nr:immunoglobulin heavy chain junction region [Macaca mulatta]MOV47988.1 immunoglobulin heavy chain junction region [Macaca mulatta]
CARGGHPIAAAGGFFDYW